MSMSPVESYIIFLYSKGHNTKEISSRVKGVSLSYIEKVIRKYPAETKECSDFLSSNPALADLVD